MNIFNLFKKSTSSDNQADGNQTSIPLDEQNPSNRILPDNVITITYGTGMPIDVIYSYITKDFEQDGYQDALINASVEYCTSKENIILNQLHQLFDRILLRYNADIREIDVQIANAKSLFILTSASHLEARKETCKEHIAEINKMIDKVKAKDPRMMTMIESYRRGFAKGCAAQAANFINPTPKAE